MHQHVWPAAFLDALRARREPPRLDGWTLLLAGEPPYAVDPDFHDPVRRAEQATADGARRVLVGVSAVLGLADLPPAEAAALAAAWHDGALALPEPFRPWATAGLVAPDPGALRDALERGCVGLEVPATAVATPDALEDVGGLLEVLERAGKPLLVHPGPCRPAATAGLPVWWAPVVPYVQQLHAAWWAWSVAGRAAHPTLKVCFAALAGLAPLHDERRCARGGDLCAVDPDVFVETSCYGTRAVDATIRSLGVDVICHGSDRPYAAPTDPGLGAPVTHALRITNPDRMLGLAA